MQTSNKLVACAGRAQELEGSGEFLLLPLSIAKTWRNFKRTGAISLDIAEVLLCMVSILSSSTLFFASFLLPHEVGISGMLSLYPACQVLNSLHSDSPVLEVITLSSLPTQI